jgi:hypothetical protein
MTNAIRPVQLADLERLVLTLLALPVADRPAALEAILTATICAKAHHALTGRAHPCHGTGTLMSAVAHLPSQPRPAGIGADYLDCLALVAGRIRKIML